MHESEMPERKERELPGDADDSMEWLEELAGDTGALWGDPLPEEPVMSNEPAEEPINESSSGRTEVESEPSEQESEPVPEWLMHHLETTELPDSEEESESTQVEAEQDTMASARIPAIPDSGDDHNVEEAAAGQFAEDLSWLDRIASGEGTAIEEPLTMRWEESDEGPEEQATEHEDSAVEQMEEVPENADEAMAWLEKLAVRQGAPSEELTMPDAPSTGEIPEGADTADPINITTIPEDPDEAVAWLEQLAAQQGTPDEELTTVREESYGLVQEIVPPVDDELDSAIEELAGVAMPEDSDEALAWLGELADIEDAEPEIEISESEVEVVEEPPTPVVEHDVVAARAEAEILFAQEQTIEAAAESPPQGPEVIPGEESDLEAVDIDGRVETGIDVADGVELEEIEERVDSVFPGESYEDEAATRVDEELDWLDSLDEGDAVSWLESESVASEMDVIEDEADERVIADEPDAEVEFAEPALESRETALEVTEDTPLDQAGVGDVERLELARSAVKAGDWTAVADEYEALLESGEGLPYLISDLETSVEVHEQQPILKRLLGDAYVRNGQLERAVDVYRQALDQL